ncbi:MAG: PQQ-binding-like beta-propeller repeat protein [Planctomycetales bacterium]
MPRIATPLATFAGLLLVFLAAAARGDDWPQWRGPNRDAVSRETGLLKAWPERGPAVDWQVENAGVGFSSLAVRDGRVVTQGDLDGVEHTIAFDEKTGRLLWAAHPEPLAKALAERLDREFGRMDKDGDGKLDELEALAGMGWNFTKADEPAAEGDSAAIAKGRAAFLFAQLDKNGDGRLDASEAPAALQQQFDRIDREDKSADKQRLAESRAAALLKAHDADGDGRVSKQESRSTPLDRIFGRADKPAADGGKADELLSTEELTAYFTEREPGRDGEVTRDELEGFYAASHPKADGVLRKEDLRGLYGGYRNSYGDGPRGTPTIDGDRVYVEGGSGDVTCFDAATGKTIWHVSLAADLGGGRPGWGYSESPLVVDDLVIVTPGGKGGTLAALDKVTGEVAWRTAAATQGAHYSSPVVAEIAGVRQIVQFAGRTAFGVTMDGANLLWEYDGANNGTANIATAIVDGDRLLFSSSYGKGTGLVEISADTSVRQKAEQVYFTNQLANHHGGMVKVGDHVYSFGSGGLMCLEFDTGEVAWRNRSIGKGSLIHADGMLYCLGERHEVALVEATPEEYRERGRFKIEEFGRPAWAHPVVANGRLYIRNMHRLTAYDVRAGE